MWIVHTDGLVLRVNIRDGGEIGRVGQGNLLFQESHELNVDNGEISLDDLNVIAPTLVFETAGKPFGYQVSVAQTTTEQGASGSLTEVVIELIAEVRTAAWDVLAAQLVRAFSQWLSDRHGDN